MKKRAGLAITLIILVLLFLTLRDIDFQEALAALNQINFYYLALSFILIGLSLAAWTLRWKHTLKGFIEARFIYLYRLILAGAFINTITPGKSVGGEPVRAYFLHKKYNKSQTKILGYIFADQVFSLIGTTFFLILAVILALIVIDLPVQASFLPSTLFIAIPVIAILALVLWKFSRTEIHVLAKELYKLRNIHRHFRDQSKFEEYIWKKLGVFIKFFEKEVTDRRKIYFGILLSVFYKLFEFLAAYAVFLALGVETNFLIVVIVVAMSNLLGDISPVPGGIGVIESSMIVLYTASGISPATAAIAALLTRLVYYIHVILLGGISLAQLRMNKE